MVAADTATTVPTARFHTMPSPRSSAMHPIAAFAVAATRIDRSEPSTGTRMKPVRSEPAIDPRVFDA